MESIQQMFEAHDLWYRSDEAQGQKGEIQDAVIENLTLNGLALCFIEMSGCTFINCRFTDVDLYASFLGGCQFRGCSFTDCIFGKAVMKKVSVRETVFLNCTLIKTDMYNAVLENVTFSGCDLTRLWFTGDKARAEHVTMTDCGQTDGPLPPW